MRTTVVFESDVEKAIDQIRQENPAGLSKVVNELIRAGLMARRHRKKRFQQRAEPIGLLVDVTNVAEALELLEGPAAR
jgi:hypothetical protein